MPADPLPVVLVEWDAPQLAPLADLRPVCCVRTGALTLLERLRHRERTRGDIRILGIACDPETSPLRTALCAEASGLPLNQFDTWTAHAQAHSQGVVLTLDSSLPIPPEEAFALPNDAVLADPESTRVLASRMDASALREWLRGGTVEYRERTLLKGLPQLSWPWHVKTHRDRALAHDLAILTKDGPHAIPRMVQLPGVTAITDCAAGKCAYMHPTAKVSPATIFDCDQGPIVLDAHATVRPGAILIGPCYVGPHSTILERATIRPGTAIGPWCKVNGEVAGTIFQGYANKAHDGYLGDSWIGEWVNLGAGTTNSNLLNTYTEVIAKATPEGRHMRTGEQFLGAIIGDHVKTAICTRIMTGAILHTGSMFATTAPVSGCVPGFTWNTDAGTKPYRFDKFLEVARAAMGRRKVAPSDGYTDALRSLSHQSMNQHTK
jgi:UDP-N-acetylglucosamine diphosphorylase/glucosamine-1-phosphate N-acetyltransferase